MDTRSTDDLLKIINDEDRTVPGIVQKSIPDIARLVDSIAEHIKNGGRLIYIGAGTAGRLGVLDAAECIPTFGAKPDTVIPVIAGGTDAIIRPSEGVEDDPVAGSREIEKLAAGPMDVVIGIVASGKAPYVIGALKRARELGAETGAIVNVSNPEVSGYCDHLVTLLVGPEVIAGSSRMKAGTSEKLVLNMISTAVFVRLGKVHDNLMIDLKPVNEKLRERIVIIVSRIAGVDRGIAKDALLRSDWDLKVAVLILRLGIGPDSARMILEKSGGNLRTALTEANSGN